MGKAEDAVVIVAGAAAAVLGRGLIYEEVVRTLSAFPVAWVGDTDAGPWATWPVAWPEASARLTSAQAAEVVRVLIERVPCASVGPIEGDNS